MENRDQNCEAQAHEQVTKDMKTRRAFLIALTGIAAVAAASLAGCGDGGPVHEGNGNYHPTG